MRGYALRHAGTRCSHEWVECGVCHVTHVMRMCWRVIRIRITNHVYVHVGDTQADVSGGWKAERTVLHTQGVTCARLHIAEQNCDHRRAYMQGPREQ